MMKSVPGGVATGFASSLARPSRELSTRSLPLPVLTSLVNGDTKVKHMDFEPKKFLTGALAALLITVPCKTIHGQSNPVQFVDITAQAGITFKHVSSPEKKYIVESMRGGVALFDYDNDGYLDMFLVNSLTVELLKSNKRTRSALYRNNGDGTFTDVTDKAGVADIGWGIGVAGGGVNN